MEAERLCRALAVLFSTARTLIWKQANSLKSPAFNIHLHSNAKTHCLHLITFHFLILKLKYFFYRYHYYCQIVNISYHKHTLPCKREKMQWIETEIFWPLFLIHASGLTALLVSQCGRQKHLALSKNLIHGDVKVLFFSLFVLLLWFSPLLLFSSLCSSFSILLLFISLSFLKVPSLLHRWLVYLYSGLPIIFMVWLEYFSSADNTAKSW